MSENISVIIQKDVRKVAKDSIITRGSKKARFASRLELFFKALDYKRDDEICCVVCTFRKLSLLMVLIFSGITVANYCKNVLMCPEGIYEMCGVVYPA